MVLNRRHDHLVISDSVMLRLTNGFGWEKADPFLMKFPLEPFIKWFYPLLLNKRILLFCVVYYSIFCILYTYSILQNILQYILSTRQILSIRAICLP